MAETTTKTCAKCQITKPGTDFHRQTASRDGLQSRCKDCNRQRHKETYAAGRAAAAHETVIGPRRCRTCEQMFPAEYFQANYANKDGRSNVCRACRAEYYQDYYQRNREAVRAANARWRAKDPIALRERDRARFAQKRAVDPVADNEKAREWRARNRERARRISRNYYARNRTRRRQQAREYQRLWREANRDLASIKDAAKRARRRGHQILVISFTPGQLAQRMSVFSGCWMCGGPKETVDHVKPVVAGGPHILANLRPACRSCNSSKRDTWPFPVAV